MCILLCVPVPWPGAEGAASYRAVLYSYNRYRLPGSDGSYSTTGAFMFFPFNFS